MWYWDICRFTVAVFIVSIWLGMPIMWLLWWIQKMCNADGSVHGLFMFWGYVGSSYVMVSAVKWAITCLLGNGPVCGE
jgi:hypothetical protein